MGSLSALSFLSGGPPWKLVAGPRDPIPAPSGKSAAYSGISLKLSLR